MSEDYLWDRSGQPDPVVADLEHALSPLAFDERVPLLQPSEASAPIGRNPSRGKPGPGWIGIGLSAVLAAAAALLVWWWGFSTGRSSPIPAPQPAPVQTAPAVADRGATGSAPVKPALHRDPVVHPIVDQPAPPDAASARPAPSRSWRRSVPTRQKPEPTPPPPSNPQPEVECILGPGQCSTRDADVPAKLATGDIRAGIQPLKPKAKACFPEHGTAEDWRVTIKLSIAGATGRVTSSVPMREHADTELGRCVAAVLEEARFPRFRAEHLGVIYPITR